jgi:glutamine cyclotransferase
MKYKLIYLIVFFPLLIFAQDLNITTISPIIIRAIPHDTNAFTQGLFYFNGYLYESTGLYNKSSFRLINVKNGEIKRIIPVKDIFAEGCAKMCTTVVQLSWKERTAIVYNISTLSQIKAFYYEGEGWGLTSNDSLYYMSNGSDTIYVRNNKFNVIKKIPVTVNKKPLLNLNELEFVNGYIYANVWFDNFIYKINIKSGNVVKIVDCKNIIKANGSNSNQDVLNGIAFNKDTKTFFLTGKNWKYIFEVRME